jgi:hypothetical protein
MLNYPDHSDPIHLSCCPWKRSAITNLQVHLIQSDFMEISLRAVDLFRVDVYSAKTGLRVLQADLSEYCAHAAANLQKSFMGMQFQVALKQEGMLICLLDQALLFALTAAMNVCAFAHGCPGVMDERLTVFWSKDAGTQIAVAVSSGLSVRVDFALYGVFMFCHL